MFALAAITAIQAATITIKVTDTRCQKITGFGAADCDGAMCPYANDTQPVKLLYGNESPIGLNIMRMEISPNFKGNLTAADVGWDTPYDWYGSVPCAKEAKKRGALVFGTPWSPPGEYKTNGTAQGGNSESQGYKRGELRADCYEKFFPWLNTFLNYMKNCGVKVDAVSVQNEPDWWVSYSGCLYTPEQQLNLVKNYASMLDREKLKKAAELAAQYGKEVWMTEHSSTDNIGNRLPNWHEQLLFAEELNECMVAGCTGYVYWYMRAHWAFVGTGESQYGADNKKNTLLPRAYVMSHFSKYVTGSTRLAATSSVKMAGDSGAPLTETAFEYSAYIKGDSLIVMAIDTTKNAHQLKLQLPVKVKSGTHVLSTGNETENLCQKSPISISTPVQELTVIMPARSLNTYIFIIDKRIDGDVNGDAAVGIGDIISVTNYMANGEQSGITLEQADVNGDGQVGIGDIISIANIMASKGN